MKANVCAHGRLSSEGHNEQRLTRWTNDNNLLFRAWSEDMHLYSAEIAYHQLIKIIVLIEPTTRRSTWRWDAWRYARCIPDMECQVTCLGQNQEVDPLLRKCINDDVNFELFENNSLICHDFKDGRCIYLLTWDWRYHRTFCLLRSSTR